MTELTSWKKQEIDKMRKELEQLFRRFRRDFGVPRSLLEPAEAVKIDLAESENTLTVTVDLPDIRPEDIKISVTEDTITLSAASSQNRIEKDPYVQKVEKRFRSFSQAIVLPCRIETDAVTATYQEKMLTIVLPKRKPKEARGVEIRAQ
jgi:HSP20 family protein